MMSSQAGAHAAAAYVPTHLSSRLYIQNLAQQNQRFALVRHRQAAFSNDPKNDYRSKFEDLLGKASTPLSKEEQAHIDKQVEAKRQLDEEAQRRLEQEKHKKAEQTVKDFERLSKGEQEDPRNLQQLFTDFYSNLNERRKNIDVKDSVVNSAKSSLGSLS